MFAEFSVKNFRSIKERQTFSLVASKNKELLEENTFEIDKTRLLKTAVMYGANASGKSNFFQALAFFLRFTCTSFKEEVDTSIKTEPFLFDLQTMNQSSEFESIFFIDGLRYRYGFGVNANQIEYEYLFSIQNVREVYLFTRENQLIKVNPTYFKEGVTRKEFARKNATFLSVCAQNNGEVSTRLISWFKNIPVFSGFKDHPGNTISMIQNAERKAKILRFLKYADIQVTDLKTEKEAPDFSIFPDSKLKQVLVEEFGELENETVRFGHPVYQEGKVVNEYFLDARKESAGTQKLFEYAEPIFRALELGTPLFIDEFDTKLHPMLIEAVFNLFQSQTTNPKNSQLIVSSHAVSVMTKKLFRRDQIWFFEKDRFGASEMYSLVEYKEAVRNDASFNKNYMQGKYGAIPFLQEIFLQTECGN
jgi:AAA15 family ATPase/GTPase